MSLPTVSYKQAAQVATIAVAAAVVPPVGVCAGIGTMGLGAIGYFGMEFADKVWQRYLVARERRLHCLVPSQDLSPMGKEEVVEKVLNRLKLERNDRLQLSSECFSENGDDKFKQDLKKGCCYGAVSTLFYKVLKEGLSIEKSAAFLEPEEVFYRQLIQWLGVWNKIKKKSIDAEIQIVEATRNEKRFKNCVDFLTGCLDVSTQGILEGLKEFGEYEKELTALREKKTTYKEERTYLKTIDPLLFASLKSRKFSPELSHRYYQNVFDEVLDRNNLKNRDFGKEGSQNSDLEQVIIAKRQVTNENANSEVMGIVRIPKHVIGFHCSSDGYYIFDTFSKNFGGLLRYSTREDFFRKVRELVLEAAPSDEEKVQREFTARFHFLDLQNDAQN